MPKKTISCGVIITDGNKVLMGHPTGHNTWNIPKGQVDGGESFLQTAVRELQEETGLVVNPADLSPLGRFAYTSNKDLVLYLYRVSEMPDANMLHCDSTFTQPRTGKQLPELDKFAVVEWDQAILMANDGLKPVLSDIQNTVAHG
jgi:8-oxo-dGTP pyrophosphatase MutT (NUDIX family)